MLWTFATLPVLDDSRHVYLYPDLYLSIYIEIHCVTAWLDFIILRQNWSEPLSIIIVTTTFSYLLS